jgi:phosphate/sulfate permease
VNFWDAASSLALLPLVALIVALVVAFAFEFINGFHDTANAVTTVIYTRSLPPTPAVLYSGFLNFLGVLLGGTAVAFGIVNLLPVDLLVDSRSGAALVMVLSLLLSGVIWNLGTWYYGLPVSSSHTLIGSIVGVGIANSVWNSDWAFKSVNKEKLLETAGALLLSPFLGFLGAAVILLGMKAVVRTPRLYTPPVGDDRPPWWIRSVLILTCGGVSFAHGENDGQKGMGLLMLVLIGFLPLHYALSVTQPDLAPKLLAAAGEVRKAYAAVGQPVPEKLAKPLATLEADLPGMATFDDLPLDTDTRWEVRTAARTLSSEIKKMEKDESLPEELRKPLAKVRKEAITPSFEYVPLWAVVGTALALGIGTTVGYKRIVVTVAEKIGKQHLTYAQGAAAEMMATITIFGAARLGLPVSTTHVLNSAVAGTMVANGTGVQPATVKKILLAWVFTLPACILMSAGFFTLGRLIFG